MAGKSRHVDFLVNGSHSWHPQKAMGDDFEDMKKAWNESMKKHSIKNYEGENGWPSSDQYHFELSKAKLSQSSKGAKECLHEYVRLTRIDKKTKNTKFESDYYDLQNHILKSMKKNPRKK